MTKPKPPYRRDRGTRVVRVGPVKIGGDNPVVVQSMTNTDTREAEKTLAQIKRLARAGCELVRVAVPDQEAAKALPALVKGSPLPLVADIHFDHKLALAALEAGVHGLRLNPGNLRSPRAVKEVIKAAAERAVPIRVGVNAGSLPRDLRNKHRGDTASALVESALEHLRLLEDAGYDQVKVSLKASEVMTTVEAYRRMRELRDYPLHLGITEAGTLFSGLVKSSAGLAILLAEGIGDTIRVSLAADPVEEVRAALALLRALELKPPGLEVIACPTCARALPELDVFNTAEELERRLAEVHAPLRIAVMGCGVNGPGEARRSDLGAVGTPKGIQLYVKGRRAGIVPPSELVDWMVAKARELAREKNEAHRES